MPAEKFPSPNLQVVDHFVQERENPEREKFSLKTPESLDFPEVVVLMDRIAELTSGWNPVEIYTASNLAAEKEKFINSYLETGSASNPQFEYAVAEELDFSTAREKLSSIRREALDLAKETKRQMDGDPEAQLKYYAALLTALKVNDDLATCDMVEGINSRDDKRTKDALIKKYTGLMKEAAKVLDFETAAYYRDLIMDLT